MPAPIPFSAPGFSVVSAKQVTVSQVRVTFSAKPNSFGAGSTSALNLSNYVLTGPTTLNPIGVQLVAGDENSVDVQFSRALDPGSYSLDILNIVGA